MGIESKVMPLYLNGRSGNGAVPTGAYTFLVGENFKRRWFALTVPLSEPDPLLLVLARSIPGAPAEFTNIYVATGSSVILSMSGDMPWQGPIYATGLAAESYCYWSEAEDYP